MISCITSTYNRPELLERAIKSVDAQIFTDWEHIIVHDGPASKATKDVFSKYASDKRILIELPKNHGNHTKPKNEGIRQAKGEYICYLDDDNEYFPNFMETLNLELSMSSYDVVYGDMRLYKDEKDMRGAPGIMLNFDPQFLLNRNYIDTNEVLHKREAVFRIGGWDESLPRFADWNLFVRMAKAGLSFKRIPILLTRYYITDQNSAEKHPVKTWQDERTGLTMFDPTWFSPASCHIYAPYLKDENTESEIKPKVAVFTVTKDRLEYTKANYDSLKESTTYPWDWFVFDNGSNDGTVEWLVDKKQHKWMRSHPENRGLTFASNACIDEILRRDEYDIIVKVDNDCLFETKGWLEDFVDLWKRNHMLYLGPYPEGLVDHPGGPWRVGHATIGDEFVEVTKHISGICAFIDASAYRNFRWRDEFLHGQQDGEASEAFIKMGYQPTIIPRHRIQHMDTTAGQEVKYPDYFKKRKEEKTTKVKRSYREIQEQESAFSENTIWGERVKESVDRFKHYFKGKVLDIGCNDGTAMEELKKLEKVESVDGVDIDKEKITRAQEKGLDVSEAEMDDLIFKDKTFDVVFCSHTFEHAEDGKKAAGEIMRVSKRAIIIVPIEQSTTNAAHSNPISSPEQLKSFFPGARVLFESKMNRLEPEYAIVIEYD